MANSLGRPLGLVRVTSLARDFVEAVITSACLFSLPNTGPMAAQLPLVSGYRLH